MTDAAGWFLNSILFEEDLRIFVVEAMVASGDRRIVVGERTIETQVEFEITDASRKRVVRFPRAEEWRVVEGEPDGGSDGGPDGGPDRGTDGEPLVRDEGELEEDPSRRRYSVATLDARIEVHASVPPVIEPWRESSRREAD